MNENEGDSLLYLMLVEKGYYHPKAFQCLARIKADFKKFFTDEQVKNGKYLSLSREFEGTFERIYVS